MTQMQPPPHTHTHMHTPTRTHNHTHAHTLPHSGLVAPSELVSVAKAEEESFTTLGDPLHVMACFSPSAGPALLALCRHASAIN